MIAFTTSNGMSGQLIGCIGGVKCCTMFINHDKSIKGKGQRRFPKLLAEDQNDEY
jgi:hypothetical protein